MDTKKVLNFVPGLAGAMTGKTSPSPTTYDPEYWNKVKDNNFGNPDGKGKFLYPTMTDLFHGTTKEQRLHGYGYIQELLSHLNTTMRGTPILEEVQKEYARISKQLQDRKEI